MDSKGEQYYQSEFEIYNTYYSIMGMVEKNEYNKILENIALNNV